MAGFIVVVGDKCIQLPFNQGTLQQTGCSTLVKIEGISIGIIGAEVLPGFLLGPDRITSSPTMLLLNHNDGTGPKAVATIGAGTLLGRTFYNSQNTLVKEV